MITFLVLEVALAALVADGAVQRMIAEQELHHSLSRLSREVRVGVHLPAVHDGHRAGSHRLRSLLHLHEAHPVVEKRCRTCVFKFRIVQDKNDHKISKCTYRVTMVVGDMGWVDLDL